MSDLADIDNEQAGVAPVEVDRRGTLMVERESYERCVEGLKMASDGAQHLRHTRKDDWHKMALIFDKLRVVLARLGGLSTEASDTRESVENHSAQHMGVHAAYDRVYRGLDMATKGARQIASCHRGDLRWSAYAMKIEQLRDMSSLLIRMKQSQSSIILPPGYTAH